MDAAAIADAYGLGAVTSLARAARGAVGQVWRLETSTGTYAVKQLLWDVPPEETVATEVRFCEASGIRAPRNLRTTAGDYLCTAPEAVVRVATWVEGRAPRVDDPDRATWVGSTLGRLHRLDFPVGEAAVDTWFTTVRTPDEWLDLADRADAAGAPWAATLRASLPHFADLTEYVGDVDPGEVVLCHTDLQPSNVLVDGACRYTLLDWDVGPQQAARSLGRVLCDWHLRQGEVDIRGARESLAAYRAAGGQASVGDLAAFGDRIAGYLNYVAAQAEGSMDQRQSAEMRAHAAGEVAAYLSDPLDLAACERLVQVLRGR